MEFAISMFNNVFPLDTKLQNDHLEYLNMLCFMS